MPIAVSWLAKECQISERDAFKALANAFADNEIDMRTTAAWSPPPDPDRTQLRFVARMFPSPRDFERDNTAAWQVNRIAALIWLKSTDKEKIKKIRKLNATEKGGRPLAKHWDFFWSEVFCRYHEKSLPESPADLVKELQEWFSEQFDMEPAESEIKKRISILYQTFSMIEKTEQ